ncbi:uncharacterized protein LOC114186966 [Vigna unguiculata]|uniref:Elongin-A n=1 Tax=Vigna unguiculata TaxID=3917 RepID=A0A4D6KKA4_VIGUN|nr:uncharacterized protein LOC114186966 [Vigna unguiculata]QCD78416.1 elongin-A [Vigna unguiculata]
MMRRSDQICAPKIPTLVDLCVQTVIDNVRYLGDVGHVDQHLLERILPHCTVDQLMHVEKSTKGRDLSPITDKLWKRFFEKQFGINSTNEVMKRMKEKKVSFKWSQLYEAKGKEMAQVENEAFDRIKQLYKKVDARKQSRQVRPCTIVPPSSKRRFWGDNGPGYNVSNVKSNIMKKAKIEFMKSQEVKNIAAMKKNCIQRRQSSPSVTKNRNISGFGSSSKDTKSTKGYFKDSPKDRNVLH